MRKTLGTHNYYVYILTNKNKTVLYVGITNNLKNRLYYHNNPDSTKTHFTLKYKCKYLLFYEHYKDVEIAIQREKQIKRWNRSKKERIINQMNPNWDFLNHLI